MQSLFKRDDITAMPSECMERVENVQLSVRDVSLSVDGLSSAQQQLSLRCDNSKRCIATRGNASLSTATEASLRGMISSIVRRLQRFEELS